MDPGLDMVDTHMLPDIDNSAASAASRAGILPPEILLRIFWETVPLHHEHDPSIILGPNSSWMRSLRTRKALTLVSRSWHGPAIEVLYADIVLQRMYQVTLLAKSLRTSHYDHTGLVRALRLDQHCFTQQQELTHAQDGFAFIFSSCTRLRSISYRADPDTLLQFYDCDPFWILPLLLNSAPNSANMLQQLRDLELGFNALTSRLDPPSFKNCHELLQIATRLVSLRLGHYASCTDVEEVRGQTLSLPCLQDLQLSTGVDADRFTSYVVDTWSMSNLTSLTVINCFQFPMPLLLTHGRRLRYLHLFSRIGPLLSAWFDTDPFLHLASLCPVLEHLVLRRPEVTPIELHSQSLRYLDIWHFGREEDPIWERKYLRRADSSLPSLRCVRLLLTVGRPWGTGERSACGSPDWPQICHPELLDGTPDGILYHRISGSWVVQTASIVAPEFMGTVVPAGTEDEDDSALQPDADVLAAVLEEQDLGPEDADAEYDYPLDMAGESGSDNESAGSSEWWDDEDSVEPGRDDGSDEGMDVDVDEDDDAHRNGNGNGY